MTITQVITALPSAPNPATDTPTAFSEKAAAFVAAQQAMVPELNTWRVQANALEANVNSKEEATDADALATATARDLALGAKTAAETAKTGAETARADAETARDLAQAAATQIGTAAAFIDSNPIAKGSVDATKRVRFECDNLVRTGDVVTLIVPPESGVIATLNSPEVLRNKSYFDAGTSLTIDYTKAIHQRWAPGSGNKTLVISNWPAAGEHAELMIEGIGLGLANVTFPSYIWWLRYDGTYAQNFSYSLATLQGGTQSDFLVLWSREGSNRVFGKVVR